MAAPQAPRTVRDAVADDPRGHRGQPAARRAHGGFEGVDHGDGCRRIGAGGVVVEPDQRHGEDSPARLGVPRIGGRVVRRPCVPGAIPPEVVELVGLEPARLGVLEVRVSGSVLAAWLPDSVGPTAGPGDVLSAVDACRRDHEVGVRGVVVVNHAIGVVTTLVPVVQKAQSKSMITDSRNLGTQTDSNMSTGNAHMVRALKVRTAVKAGGARLNHSDATGLRVRTSVKAGGTKLQHSEAKGLKVRTPIKVGGPSIVFQHSEAKVLRVRSSVKAGGRSLNHSEAADLRLCTR